MVSLKIPRAEARERLGKQIQAGQDLLKGQWQDFAELDQARREGAKWSEYNVALLSHVVDVGDLALEYRKKVLL